MAKQNKTVKGALPNKSGNMVAFEHQESYDDSLLPDAAELAKLKELDPDIMNWIKSRTEKEQDARLEFNAKKVEVLTKASKRAYIIDFYSITCAFLIIICGMLLSALLIYKGEKIIGTIFAGATILVAANSFLNFRKGNQKTKLPGAEK